MLCRNFGPWTTALDSGSRLELSAFWKQRMRRLDGLRLGRPPRLAASALLVGVAVATGAIPLVRAAPPTTDAVLRADDEPAVADAPAADDAAARDLAKKRAEQRLRATLRTPMDVSFAETTLEDGLKYLTIYHQIEMRIDEESLKKANISLEGPISMQLEGVTFRAALNLLLEPLKLSYFIEGGQLVITTSEMASTGDRRLVPPVVGRVYDVSDIAGMGFETPELAGILKSLIAPSTWQPNKTDALKKATGLIHAEQQTLPVRQREDVHERIRGMLNELRRAHYRYRRPLAPEPIGKPAYAIGDLRHKSVPDEQVFGVIGGSLSSHARRGDGVTVMLEYRGDEIIVGGQTAWGDEAARAFLAALRHARRADPRGPLTDEQLNEAYEHAGGELEADRRSHRRALSRKISAEFAATPLKDVLKLLSQEGQINLVLATMATPQGAVIPALSPDLRITLTARERSLADVLEELCAAGHLDWIESTDVILITTAAAAREQREYRVHRLQEALAAGYGEKEIRDRIVTETSFLMSHTWDPENPSAGRIQVAGGCLFVVHNPRIQRDIERIIEQLERTPKK